MTALTNEYWVRYRNNIITTSFLLWIALSVTSLAYFAIFLDIDYNDYFKSRLILGVIVLSLSFFNIALEATQIKQDYEKYFENYRNYIDLIQYLGTIIIVTTSMIEGP